MIHDHVQNVSKMSYRKWCWHQKAKGIKKITGKKSSRHEQHKEFLFPSIALGNKNACTQINRLYVAWTSFQSDMQISIWLKKYIICVMLMMHGHISIITNQNCIFLFRSYNTSTTYIYLSTAYVGYCINCWLEVREG